MRLPLFPDEDQNPGLNFQFLHFVTYRVTRKDPGLELSLSTWRSRLWKDSLNKVGKNSGWDFMQNPSLRGDSSNSPSVLADCLESKLAE